jgi:predicted enzyme related to lactoylglutathione lyase
MPNPVTQFQIISTAPDETARFYSDLFDWMIDANNPMGYRQISTGSTDGIHGGIWPAPPQATNFVQLFITVADAAAAVAKAEKLGAKLLIPLTALPGGETMAVMHDPCGMSFAVWQNR